MDDILALQQLDLDKDLNPQNDPAGGMLPPWSITTSHSGLSVICDPVTTVTDIAVPMG